MRLRAAVEGGEWVEFSPGDDAVAGYRRTVIDRPRGEVDPCVTVRGGPECSEAFGECRGGITCGGGVGVSVRFMGIGLGFGEVEEVEMEGGFGRFGIRVGTVVVLVYDGVDWGEGDGLEGGSEWGRGGLEEGG